MSLLPLLTHLDFSMVESLIMRQCLSLSLTPPHPPHPTCSWAPLLFVWTFFCFWVFVCLHIVEGAAYYCSGSWVNGNEGMFAIAW